MSRTATLLCTALISIMGTTLCCAPETERQASAALKKHLLECLRNPGQDKDCKTLHDFYFDRQASARGLFSSKKQKAAHAFGQKLLQFTAKQADDDDGWKIRYNVVQKQAGAILIEVTKALCGGILNHCGWVFYKLKQDKAPHAHLLNLAQGLPIPSLFHPWQHKPLKRPPSRAP